jgi:hypothetical protein
MAWYAWQLFVLLLRGPHCERFTWIGYEGGFEYRKSVVVERRRKIEEEGIAAVAEGGTAVGKAEKNVGGGLSEGNEDRREPSMQV